MAPYFVHPYLCTRRPWRSVPRCERPPSCLSMEAVPPMDVLASACTLESMAISRQYLTRKSSAQPAVSLVSTSPTRVCRRQPAQILWWTRRIKETSAGAPRHGVELFRRWISTWYRATRCHSSARTCSRAAQFRRQASETGGGSRSPDQGLGSPTSAPPSCFQVVSRRHYCACRSAPAASDRRDTHRPPRQPRL